MQFVAEWLRCDDGVARPAVYAHVYGAAGQAHADYFLVETGAVRTVFSRAIAIRLQLPSIEPPAGAGLIGVGGRTEFEILATTIGLSHAGGGIARVRGEFAAFKDTAATDLSILGRDVLNHFDLIMSRRSNEVLLLAPNHQYRIVRSG